MSITLGEIKKGTLIGYKSQAKHMWHAGRKDGFKLELVNRYILNAHLVLALKKRVGIGEVVAIKTRMAIYESGSILITRFIQWLILGGVSLSIAW